MISARIRTSQASHFTNWMRMHFDSVLLVAVFRLWNRRQQRSRMHIWARHNKLFHPIREISNLQDWIDRSVRLSQHCAQSAGFLLNPHLLREFRWFHDVFSHVWLLHFPVLFPTRAGVGYELNGLLTGFKAYSDHTGRSTLDIRHSGNALWLNLLRSLLRSREKISDQSTKEYETSFRKKRPQIL